MWLRLTGDSPWEDRLMSSGRGSAQPHPRSSRQKLDQTTTAFSISSSLCIQLAVASISLRSLQRPAVASMSNQGYYNQGPQYPQQR